MDLYELILKSVRAEVLVPKGLEEEGSFHRALDWRMQMTWTGAVGIGLFCFFFGIAGLLFNYAVAIPTSFGEGLVGYLLVIFALSVGQVLAACLLRYYDCEVYYPYIDWRTLLPHFRLDLGDAVMAGRFCGIGIGLLRMAPLFLVTGMCAFSFPRFEFPLLVAIFWSISLLGDTPARQILSATFDQLHLSTDRDFLFVERHRLREILLRPHRIA